MGEVGFVMRWRKKTNETRHFPLRGREVQREPGGGRGEAVKKVRRQEGKETETGRTTRVLTEIVCDLSWILCLFALYWINFSVCYSMLLCAVLRDQ